MLYCLPTVHGPNVPIPGGKLEACWNHRIHLPHACLWIVLECTSVLYALTQLNFKVMLSMFQLILVSLWL